MPHTLASAMATQIAAAANAPVLFVEVDTPAGNVYFWTGYGTVTWNSHTWTGAGNLISISSVQESVTVQASGVSVTLTGVPSANISLVLVSLSRLYPMKIWLGALNSSFAVVADPYLFFNGLVDTAEIIDNGPTSTIIVSGESRLIAMKNPRERRYTDGDQRIERPSDGGFKFVDFLQKREIPWGAAGAAQSAAPAPSPIMASPMSRLRHGA